MKKLQSITTGALFLIVLLFMMGDVVQAQQFEGEFALFVVADEVYPNTAETLIIERLEDMGFDVTLIGQDFVDDSMGEDNSIVLISATVSSGTVAGNMPFLAELAVPVINWEPFLYDHMGFQELDGSEFNGTEIMIVDDTHPLAAGLSADIWQVALAERGFSYGTPEGDVSIIATSVDADSQVVLFGYDTGAAMFAGTAPARRVGTFLLNDVADTLTEEGWALFDASVIWAMGADEPNTVDAALTELSTFALYGNYPNPFNPATQITFSIPEQTHVTLSVWNTRGEHVTTLVNEVRPAGDHAVPFHAGDLSSGMYFYRLETQTNAVTKKMMLLK